MDTSEVNVRYDAFISYPRENRRDVLKIVEAISKAGIKVFYDEEMRPGERWATCLPKPFLGRYAVVLHRKRHFLFGLANGGTSGNGKHGECPHNSDSIARIRH